MDKYVILKLNSYLLIDDDQITEIVLLHSFYKLSFITLTEQGFPKQTLEYVKDFWSEKGQHIGFQDGTQFMLDEPSGFIYCYNYFDAQDYWYAWKKTLSPEQKIYMFDHPDDGPFIVDFIKEEKIEFYSKMHKNNFFELFEKWNNFYTNKNIHYLVWYEDTNDWVHLEGFETEEQARDFVTNN